MDERIAVLGASRGLGRAFVKAAFPKVENAEWLLIARKKELLSTLAADLGSRTQIISANFAKSEDQQKVKMDLRDFAPTRVLYFAGGGPYGDFRTVGMKDHRWAWEVTFLFPAEILHFVLSHVPEVKQTVFIGSAIAEDAADPKAASYAAAKHALRGLVRSVQAEKPALDLRLYSPGYMDTELLPAHAWPRQQGLVMDTGRVAQDLLSWIFMNDDVGIRLYK